MSQREVVSGHGEWRVVYYDGIAMRVELHLGDKVMVVCSRPYHSECADCGQHIMACDPDNTDRDMCEQCELRRVG